MAIALRLRRALALSSSIRPMCTVSSSSKSLAATPFLLLPRSPAATHLRPRDPVQCRAFHSSLALADRRGLDTSDDRKISPDEILFEGCDYNHWLITMDFPDPKPSREEMIETYLQTLAKVVGSCEEAKKRMYALSTTTYTGFQAVMTEEMSEKFRGLPGVVFILPDSYIDPVNKEYGGDKYENGVITPRPPPIQYGRQGRARNQNRYDRPSYNRPPPQGNPPYDQQGPMQHDGRNYGPQQNYSQPGQDGRGYAPQQNFPQQGQDGRGYAPQQNFPQQGQDGRGYAPQQNYPQQGQDGRGYAPQQNFPQQGQDGRGYAPQQSYSQPGQDGRGYGPPGGRDFPPPGDRRDFGPGEGRDYAQTGYQGARRDAVPPYQEHGNFSQGQVGGFGDYRQGSGPGSGDYRQGSGPGYSGDNRQGAGARLGGDNGQGSGSGYGQSYPGPIGQQDSGQGRS